MKVKVENKINMVSLKDVADGDLFRFIKNNELYVKMKNGGGGWISYLSLRDGATRSCYDNQMVIPATSITVTFE